MINNTWAGDSDNERYLYALWEDIMQGKLD